MTFFKQRLTLNSGMRAAFSNITFFKTQLKRNSVWRPRQKFYFFQTANQAESRCGDGEKLLLFYKNKKRRGVFKAIYFYFFSNKKNVKKSTFPRPKTKNFQTQKKSLKRPFWTKTFVLGSPRDPKIGFSRAIRP